MVLCNALPTPADISEQTESIRAKSTRGPVMLLLQMQFWTLYM